MRRRRQRYMKAVTVNRRVPFPKRWRGPRIRALHRGPSRIARRYSVFFDRITRPQQALAEIPL